MAGGVGEVALMQAVEVRNTLFMEPAVNICGQPENSSSPTPGSWQLCDPAWSMPDAASDSSTQLPVKTVLRWRHSQPCGSSGQYPQCARAQSVAFRMTSSCAGIAPLPDPCPMALRPESSVLLISPIQAGSAGCFLCLQDALLIRSCSCL